MSTGGHTVPQTFARFVVDQPPGAPRPPTCDVLLPNRECARNRIQRELLDLAEPLACGLAQHGLDVSLKLYPHDAPPSGADHFVVVSPLYLILAGAKYPFPPRGAVLYSTDPVMRTNGVSADIGWRNPVLQRLFRSHRVWAYSPDHTCHLREIGISARTVLPAYVPELSRPIADCPAQDIDVLFFGAPTARRVKVLSELEARGVKVFVPQRKVFGEERDALVARAKIVLCAHQFVAPRVLETARVSYLLSRRAFVVTEQSECMPWAGGYIAAPYDALVETCLSYLDKPEERARIAATGLDTFRACTMFEEIRPAVADLTTPPNVSEEPEGTHRPQLATSVFDAVTEPHMPALGAPADVAAARGAAA